MFNKKLKMSVGKKEKIKEQYHKEYQLKIIRDLSQGEIKMIYNLIKCWVDSCAEF